MEFPHTTFTEKEVQKDHNYNMYHKPMQKELCNKLQWLPADFNLQKHTASYNLSTPPSQFSSNYYIHSDNKISTIHIGKVKKSK